MYLSKKAARELGQTVATALHSCGSDPELRSGVLITRTHLQDTLSYALYCEFEAGFRATLDRLEPIANHSRAA